MNNRVIQIGALVLAVACLAGAAMLSPTIHRQREELQLSPNVGPDKTVPHRIMLTQAALGSFRGLAVDLLWYRANQLKESGQYREANQLSEIICTLQPRFPRVWVFHAWNMSYNISVATNTLEERWNWVNKGIRLLRDQGIPANPDSVLLKKELSWIFFHKMGGVSDDMHWFYRRRLAHEWQEVLGTPEGLTTAQAIERIQAIVDAPEPNALEELRKEEAVENLLTELSKLGYEPDENLLRNVGRVLMFTFSEDRGLLRLDDDLIRNFLDPRLGALMNDPATISGFTRLVPWLRKKVIIEQYHMDPAEMLRMMKEYGPIDWRQPVAHGAYWAEQGVRNATELLQRNKKGVDLINTHRLVIHSMQELMRSGRLTYDPISGYLDMMPDPRFVKSYENALNYARELIKTGDYGTGVEDNFDDGYENFLIQAVMFSYIYGDQAQAEEYYKRWREMFSDEPDNQRRLAMSLDELVWDEWSNLSGNRENTRMFIDANLRQTFLQGLAQNNIPVFRRFYGFAKRAYDEHAKRKLENPNADQGRLHLPPWPELFAQTFASIMKDRRYPLLTRARIWVRVGMGDMNVLRAVYDDLREGIYEEAKAADLDPALLLPEPPGMAEFRKQRLEQDKARLPGLTDPDPGTVLEQ